LSSIVCGYSLKYISDYLDSHISWINKIGWRLLVGILSTFCLLIFVICVLRKINTSFVNNNQSSILTDELGIKLAILVGIISIIGNILYLSYYSYNHYSQKQIKNLQFEREQIDLQLHALKAQISPHFLFNNLNTISHLIYEDQNKAEVFIRKMAACYQYILDSYNVVLVKLRDELEFVISYQFLLQTKHKNNIKIENNLSHQDMETRIPSLSLQLLVENAAKHNLSTETNPVIVKITANNKNIIISNNKTERPPNIISTELGLKNIISRYKLLGAEKIEITDNHLFTVNLPKL